MGISKIAVDLRARTFEIEVPDERIDEVLSRLEKLLQLPVADMEQPLADAPPPRRQDSRTSEGTNAANEVSQESDKDSLARRRRANGKGVAKVRSYKLVDLGLSSEQRAGVREFFEQKAPSSQNEQVAVLAVKLQALLKKDEFTPDDIHSAFKIVDKPTPKNLVAVFSNMKRDGRANYNDNNIVVNSHTEDYVVYHMVKKAANSKK